MKKIRQGKIIEIIQKYDVESRNKSILEHSYIFIAHVAVILLQAHIFFQPVRHLSNRCHLVAFIHTVGKKYRPAERVFTDADVLWQQGIMECEQHS
mgnify:CR=1 FL=1